MSILISDLISLETSIPHLKASSKKQLLQTLAGLAEATAGVSKDEILENILERERLGSTGVGGGIAIPHGRLEKLKHPIGVLARLDTPVAFESVDDQPVDIAFLLLAPGDNGAEHLKALARISRLLRDKKTCESLRGADTAEAIFAIATANEASHAA